MLAKRQRVISFLIQNLIVFRVNLCSLFSQMSGDLRPFVLEETNTMLVLLMTIANLCGSILLSTNLKFFRNFMNFKILLRGSLIARLYLCRLIGEENIKNFTPFLSALASLILFHILTLTNKTGLPNESIGILLKLA